MLNSVTQAEAEELLRDPAFFMQPKFDGRRLLLRKQGEQVTGINRRGLECGLPEPIRLGELVDLLLSITDISLRYVITQLSYPLKRELFDVLLREGAEGVVFKQVDAPYQAGRPASGGDQLKFKFVETASVVVSAVNARRSVGISVWRKDSLVPAGNVTVSPDHPVPSVGQVAEVRYLYAMPGSGSLYQPVFLGVREDTDPSECQESQRRGSNS